MARNNARRILPRLLAIGVLVLALAGCVRFQADLTLSTADTVSGNIVVAVILSDETDETREGTLASVDQIATGLLGGLATSPGVTSTEYEQDGYLGQRLTFENVPLTAFSGSEADALHFERVGDEYVFSGAIDFSGDAGTGDEAAEDDGNLTVKLTFPGAITDTDGAVTGNTVSWSTPIDTRLEMNARGAATAPGLPIGLIIGGVAGLLLLIAIVAGVLVLLSRRRQAAAAGATPATLDPAFATPAAVAPEVAGAPTPPAVIPPAAKAAATTPPAEPKAPRAPRAPKTPKAPDA
jgi:hypothetical protein